MMQRSEMPERQSTREQNTPASRQALIESRTPLLVLGVILLVFLVALGSSRSLAHVSGPSDLAGAKYFAGDLIFLLVGVIVIPAIVYVVWQSLRELRDEGTPSSEKNRERRVLKQVLAIGLIGGLLAAIALTKTHSSFNPDQPRKPMHHRVAPAKPKERSQKLAEELLPWVATGVGTCLVLLFAGALIQRRRRELASEELTEFELESPRRELHEQVGISIAEIERESDPRRAVIRAYSGMESTLGRHGLVRRPFEAPGEYLSRVFAALRLSRRPGERLTQLFEQARFSTHAIGPEMKREAIAALGELRGELEVEPR